MKAKVFVLHYIGADLSDQGTVRLWRKFSSGMSPACSLLSGICCPSLSSEAVLICLKAHAPKGLPVLQQWPEGERVTCVTLEKSWKSVFSWSKNSAEAAVEVLKGIWTKRDFCLLPSSWTCPAHGWQIQETCYTLCKCTAPLMAMRHVFKLATLISEVISVTLVELSWGWIHSCVSICKLIWVESTSN